MVSRVFIDGSYGTTGQTIYTRLEKRCDICLITLPKEDRRDLKKRLRFYCESDISVSCLPDEEARRVFKILKERKYKGYFLDASSVHRVCRGWLYALPEIFPREEWTSLCLGSQFISIPGCYSTAFILGIKPFLRNKMVKENGNLLVHGFSGFTGGGKVLIEKYSEPRYTQCPLRFYSLGKEHKHVQEMKKYSDFSSGIRFIPSTSNIRTGLCVSFMLEKSSAEMLNSEIFFSVLDFYSDYPFIRVHECCGYPGKDEVFFPTNIQSDGVNIYIYFLECSIGVIVTLDNLGKGSGTSVIQVINTLMDCPVDQGLVF